MSVRVAKSEPSLVAIQQLLLQMHQAVVQGQWLHVQTCDKEIGHLVLQLQQTKTHDLAAELALLKQRYRQLIVLAKRQQQLLEQKMKQFQQNKAGVQAYQQTVEGAE